MAEPSCGRCGRFRPGEPYTLDQCRFCWLAHHDAKHADHWRPDGTPPRATVPRGGPGTELKLLLASFGLTPGGCGCDDFARTMDEWGVDGCRARRAEIVARLAEEREKRGWPDLLAAVGRALLTGAFLRLNPFDQLGSIVEEAIRRAETKEART